MSDRAKGAQSDESIRRRLGERLKQAREYLGLSQDDVAKHLGVPRTALTNMESGQRRVEALELQQLAELYRHPITFFTSNEQQDALPADVEHLARKAASLSAQDRAELERFAEYLRTRPSISPTRKK
jgi:transcriptional regulator with XRE-family HTH domain